MSATASGEPGSLELGERALETGPGLLVAAEQVLDAGARGDEPDAQRRVRVLRHDRACSRAALAWLSANRPGGGERSRAGEQELHPLLGGRCRRQ